ncbi:MAG: IS3 family transposase [Prevotella sp.]|nr:IS3 family transposase [Prevotella sp.]
MWGQVATELVFERGLKVALVVRLFGHCRQAFYQSKADIEKEVEHERKVLAAVREIREEDPGIGGYKLWLMLISMFGRDFVPGRDRFFVLLRHRGMMLPKPKPRHTTNSNHRYRKWKNLIKDFVPTAANQLWVADITYIALCGHDVCYLHLITDAYSHKIVGWALAESLKAAISMEALKMAIEQAVAMRGDESLKGLIHHSDRGVQYCCDAYVALLQAYDISISMTEDYKPTDNAIAESVNGKIKVESVYPQRFSSFAHASRVIERFIHFYNYRRPHMSIAYKVPAVAHLEQGEQKRMWKNKIYTKKETENENNVVYLPGQMTSPGGSVSQRP